MWPIGSSFAAVIAKQRLDVRILATPDVFYFISSHQIVFLALSKPAEKQEDKEEPERTVPKPQEEDTADLKVRIKYRAS